MADQTLQQAKACSKCGTVKPLSEFGRSSQKRSGYLAACKQCSKRVRDPNERRAANQRYAERHRERRQASVRRYNEANRDEINWKARERNQTEKRRNYMREWDRQYRSMPRNRLDQRMKTAVALALKGGKAGRSWERLVGYSLSDLMAHLERQFLPGMSWENMGEWHVDHVLPKSMFSYETPGDPDFKVAWALPNLRPLWGPDNLSKGPKRLHLL